MFLTIKLSIIFPHHQFLHQFILHLVQLIIHFLHFIIFIFFTIFQVKSDEFAEFELERAVLNDFSKFPTPHNFLKWPSLPLQEHCSILMDTGITHDARLSFIIGCIILVKRVFDIDFFLLKILIMEN